MVLSVEEYKSAWDRTIPHGGWCDRVTPNTCVLSVSFRSDPAGDGLTFVDDFGHAIGYCRYTLQAQLQPPPQARLAASHDDLPGLQMMLESWKRYTSQFGPDELSRRWVAAETVFDALLQEFVREGYRPDVGQRLLAAVNASSIDLELNDIWALPGDLDRLLELTGNPLADWDAEDEEAAMAAAPSFDFTNLEHRAALAERMSLMFR
jgi:hypothetical protein